VSTAPDVARPALADVGQEGDGEPVNVRKRHFWLYIPFLSWVALVIPLVLPWIPMGPIAISFSWNRREWMPHIRRCMSHLGRKRLQLGFPFGWFVNVGINLADLATLGLTHLFITGRLLQAMIEQDGTDQERAEIPPVKWITRWLLITNIGFIGLYIACPGIIFERLLVRVEEHFYHHANRRRRG